MVVAVEKLVAGGTRSVVGKQNTRSERRTVVFKGDCWLAGWLAAGWLAVTKLVLDGQLKESKTTPTKGGYNYNCTMVPRYSTRVRTRVLEYTYVYSLYSSSPPCPNHRVLE